MKKILLITIICCIGIFAQSQTEASKELLTVMKKGKASLTEIESIINKGADVNVVSQDLGWSYGMSPVHIAAAWHKLDWLKLLVNKGADLYRVNEYDRPEGEWWSEMHHDCNALHIAIYYYDGNDRSLLNYLVQKGFDLDAYCYGGQTPLMYALMSEHTTLDAIKFLVENGADVKKTRKDMQEGALYYVCDDDVKQRQEKAKYLIEKNANADMADNYGDWNLLTLCIYFAYNDVAKLLIENNVIDVNGSDKIYISNEADVLTDMGNYLNVAVKRNNIQMAEYLIKKGLSLDVKTGDNENALDIAKRLKLKAMILLLTTGEIPDSEKAWMAIQQSDEYSDVTFKNEAEIKEFIANRLNGTSVSNATYKGKVVFLNFWATWCGFCIQEMPTMNKLAQSLSASNFAMVAVATDKASEKSAVENYIKSNNYNFDWLYDPGWEKFESYSTSMPGTFLLDKNGLIVAEIQGARDWSKPKYKKLIEALINRL